MMELKKLRAEVIPLINTIGLFVLAMAMLKAFGVARLPMTTEIWLLMGIGLSVAK